jgi:DedD protein
MSENDPQLELKKRARRRLVGAAALAVLAAIVLPMVMDQAPKQQAPVQDIQIRIPAQDAGAFTSRILPVKARLDPDAPAAGRGAGNQACRARQTGRSPGPRPNRKPKAKAEPKAAPPKARSRSPLRRRAKAPEPRATSPHRRQAADEEGRKCSKAKSDARRFEWRAMGSATGRLSRPGQRAQPDGKAQAAGLQFLHGSAAFARGQQQDARASRPLPQNKEAAEAARERIKRLGVDGVVAQK